MVDEEIKKIAHDRIRLEIGEQNNNLHREIDRIKEEMGAKGQLRGGAIIKRITDLCVETTKNRALFVWQTLFRFITTSGISHSEDLPEELKGIVAQHLPENLGDLRGHIKQITEMAGSPNLFERMGQELDKARIRALAKVGTEIDLFVHSLKKKEAVAQNGTSSTVFNIYSPVGSIQTGDSSIANVSQYIDTEVKEQIRKALEEIITALNQPEVEIPFSKGEFIEVVQESQSEVQKEKPNLTRLRSLLTTVGTSIQVVSSLKPAYETLKQALTFLGISLP
jgi:hypothetical protein